MSVAGFDIGNACSCVAVARKGGIDVLLNKESKRETPSCLSFSSKQRFMGTDAATFLSTNPKNTVTQLKRLVGKKWTDADIQKDTKLFPFAMKPSNDGGVLVQVQYLDKPTDFTPEQLLAMMLVDQKLIAQAETGHPITDCVIACPNYFTEAERYAMLSASQIAGLNCLRVMNETTALALAYGIYKSDLPESEPMNVAFVDFGHSSFQVSIVALKKGHLQVLAHAWDRNLGGRDFDEVLFQHFAAEVKEKYKKDVLASPKACFRLRLACEKLKKVLSANSESPINVECLIDDIDFASTMTRDKFEELAADLAKKALAPLEQAIAQSGVTVDKLHSVELVGGSGRVPAVLNILKDFFQKDPSRTLNAKETVARGCALQCAMLSPIFRVREFDVVDTYPFSVNVTWDKDGSPFTSPLFERGCTVPSAKMLTFFRSQPFTITASYADSVQLPEGVSRQVSVFEIGPIKLAEGQEKAKLKVKIRLNLHSLLTLDSVQQIREEEYEETVKEDKPSAAAATTPPAAAPEAATAAADGDAPMPDSQTNGTAHVEAEADGKGEDPAPMDTDAAAPAQGTKTVHKKRVIKTDLPCTTVNAAPAPAVLQAAFETECELALQAKVQEETNERKNAVEAYLYSLRNKLYDQLSEYVTEPVKEDLLKRLEAMEDWLYDEGEDQPKSVYVAKLEELQAAGRPIEERYQDAQTREAACSALSNACSRYLEAANSTDASLAHISEEERETVRKEVGAAMQWLQDKQGQQSQLKKIDPPVLTTADVRKKEEVLTRVCLPIVTKPAPAPQPKVEEPKPMDTDEATDKAPTAAAAEEGAATAEAGPEPMQEAA